MLRYMPARHYNIKLSVDKIIIIIEIIITIIINKKMKNIKKRFIYFVVSKVMVSQQCLVGPF